MNDQEEFDGTPQNGKPPGSSAMVTRQSFDGLEVAKRNELAASATQARVTAMVQAKFVMALKNPRDPAVVREKLLGRCAQLDFADVAIYRRPQGKKKNEETGRWEENIIEGLSIRFVEEAIRVNRNMAIETAVLYDDDEKQVLRIAVVDYEDVTESSSEITVYKTIERRELKKNQRPLSVRANSYGEPVYILPASDDDLRMKVARATSMTIRQNGLRMLPGGLVAEAKRRVYETLKNQDKGKDPLTVRREVADKFAELGISAAQIADYFGGVSIEQINNDQLLELRIVGATVRSGEGTWRDAIAGSPWRDDADETGEEKKQNETAAKVRDRVKAKLEQRHTGAREGASPGASSGAPPGSPAPPPPPPAPPAPAPPPAAPGAANAAPDPLLASVARVVTGAEESQISAVLALLRNGKDLAYVLRYKSKSIGIDEAACRAIAEAFTAATKPAQGKSALDPKSAEGVSSALGLPLAAVQAVLKFAGANDTASDDDIAAAMVDGGHDLTGVQVAEILRRAT